GLGEAVDAGLRRSVVYLAILAGLAIDAADIDDTAEPALAHPGEGQLAQVEAGTEIGVHHCVPHVARHALQGAVTGDPRIVHQDLDRTDLFADLRDGALAFVEVADVEFGSADTGFLVECRGGILVVAVVGDDDAALFLERDADGG